jgi:hypothetical protein
MPAWLRGKRMINLNGKALPIAQRDGQPPCFRCGTPGQKLSSCPCRLNPSIRTNNTLVLTEGTQEACAKRVKQNEEAVWNWTEMMAAAGAMTEEIKLPQELVPPTVAGNEATKLFETASQTVAAAIDMATTTQGEGKKSVMGGKQFTGSNGSKPTGIPKIVTKTGPKTSLREAACYAAANKEWKQVVAGKGVAISTVVKKGVATLQEELEVLGQNQFALLQALEIGDAGDDSEYEDAAMDEDMDEDSGSDKDSVEAGSSQDSEDELTLSTMPLTMPLEKRTKLKRLRNKVEDINSLTLQQVMDTLTASGYVSHTGPITDHTLGEDLRTELVQYPGDALRVVLHNNADQEPLLRMMGAKGLAQVGYHWAMADLMILARENVEQCPDEGITEKTEQWGTATFRALQQGDLNLHALMRTDRWWKHILPPSVHDMVPTLAPGELLLHEDSMGMMLFVAALVAHRGEKETQWCFPKMISEGYVFRLETSTFQLVRDFPIIHPAMAQYGYLHSDIFRQIVSFFLDQDFEAGLELLSQSFSSKDGASQSSTSGDSASLVCM